MVKRRNQLDEQIIKIRQIQEKLKLVCVAIIHLLGNVANADLVEIASEHGLSIERSTLCRWVQEYGPRLAKRIPICWCFRAELDRTIHV